MNSLIKLLTAGTIALSSGCATIINDDTQTVNVLTSNGQKVEIAINGMPYRAPGMAAITRQKANAVITTQDPACTQTTTLNSSVDIAFFGNIITGGFIGSTTDAASGEMWQYDDSVTIVCNG